MSRDMSDRAPELEDQIADTRGPSLGLGRIVLVVYWLFGAWTTVCAVLDLLHVGSGPLGPALVALVAGLVYLVAAVALTHNGKRMRVVGWTAVIIETVGPVIVGLLGVGIPDLTRTRSAWGGFGADYWYLPLVIAVVGLVWLWASNPRRIVERAEQIDRPGSRRRHR
jgi:MFS family permease